MHMYAVTEGSLMTLQVTASFIMKHFPWQEVAACPTLLRDHQRLYFARKKKNCENRERTRRIDSKHNRMWYRVVFHSWTRVHTPTHYTPLQYFAPPPVLSRFHACGWVFFLSFFLSISPSRVLTTSDFFPHISRCGGLSSWLQPTAAPLTSFCEKHQQ